MEKIKPLHILLLAFMALAMMWPGQTNLPPLDRDEARFTQASKQMMESGDYIDIRYQDVARHKKPAGIYWLQVLSAKAHGGPDEAPINAYRLPSLVAAVAAVLLTAVIGAHLFGAMVGVGAGVVMSALFGLGLEAHIAKTDAALLFTVLLTQWGIARLYINPSENDRLSAYLFWGGLGLGVLIKGPITPMVAGLTLVGILIWERRLALIDPLFKLAPILLFLLIALPWYIAITIVSGGSFFAEAVGQDMLGKVASGQESHGAPPGYYAGIFALAFFPFAGLALSALPAAAKARATPAIRFLIVWALPGWLLFELMPTKLPHYVLPFFPALAIATSWLVMEVGIKRNWFTRAAVAFTGFIGGVLAIGLIGAPIYAMQLPGGDMVDYPWIGGLLILSGLGLFLHTNWHLFALPPLQLIARLWAASLLILGAGFGLMAPAMSPLWIAPRLADAAALHAPCPTYQIAVAGFHEPSFVFLTDTQTLLTGPANVATILADNECAIAIVDASERAAFEDALTVPAKEVATVHGLNYSRGDERSLSLFVRAGE